MRKIIIYILFIIGICIIVYPFGARLINNKNQTIAISNYERNVNYMTNEEIDEKMKITNEYNSNLYDDLSGIELYNIGDILAYITIPKLNIKLPIYEGSTDKVLSKGVGHIKNTSLPCGGVNTHSVLVWHTGLSQAKIFDDLDKMEIGDVFYINYLENILEYRVCNIEIILPDKTNHLKIKENKDLVTLVTCTPKHINTHRLLVTGERI